MPQPRQQKLTKKQRKGLAFRQKISNKKTKGARFGEPEDVPEADIIVDDELGTSENLVANSSDRKIKRKTAQQQQNTSASQGEGEVKTKDVDVDSSALAGQSSNKRKRPQAEGDAGLQVDEDAPITPPKSKKRKRPTSEGDENIEREDVQSQTQKHKTRYILFIGNLKYTTSKEAIRAHFAHIDPPPTVRLLTPKPSKSKPSTTSKSKGCAFLEFTNRTSLQQALKLHHSILDGRQINVELTAGGGGKSAARVEKLKGRNQKLDSQRKKRLQKVSPNADSTDLDQLTSTPSNAQRHSTTSGSAIQLVKKRTWSIPEPGDFDQGISHRGGIKHANASTNRKRGSKKRKSKDLGTGVNAIPVG